ncbi:MAG TPA: hypothetical protein VFD60_14485 [Nitrososphaeraceae archaeon]|nr:hypothetical protein [Nitrososphaeraceae archaeon]
MSNKLLHRDLNDNNKGLRLLELSRNVNDYDTGKPFNCIMECRLNKKIIDVQTDLEVKTGDKYRP